MPHDFADHPPGSPQHTGTLTRTLADDAELLLFLSNQRQDLGTGEEDSVLDQLLQHFEELEPAVRTELISLAMVLPDAAGQRLRAAICRPGSAMVHVSTDRLTATLEVHPPVGGGRPIATNDLVQMLRDAGVVHGVDLHAVTALAADAASPAAKAPVKAVVAHGRLATPGIDGKLEILPSNPLPSSKRILQWMVAKGKPVATILEPTAGEPGADVLGQAIMPLPGNPAAVVIGDNLHLDPASKTYVADVDGLVSYDGHKLDIARQLIWPGDLTALDEPIRFDGNVVIRGTVRDGARLNATEDIEIQGGVEGAMVVSAQGSISIKQGIAGRDTAFISAAKSVDVRYIEHATVYCAGMVIVRHGVVHSRVFAGVAIQVTFGKGTIFGGEIRAGRTISVRVLGNASNIPTKVMLGHDWSALEQLRGLEATTATLRQHKAKCAEMISRFRVACPDPTRLNERERMALAQILKRHIAITSKLKAREEEYRQLDAAFTPSQLGELTCSETLFPGVTIKICGSVFTASSNLPACRIRFNATKAKITVESPTGRPLAS